MRAPCPPRTCKPRPRAPRHTCARLCACRHNYQTKAYLALHPSMDQLSCCGIDALDVPVLDWGVLEQREAAALATPHATLGEAARRRAVQLFSHGEGVAYGAAFSAAFAPADAVVAGVRLRRDDARKSRSTTRQWGMMGGSRLSTSSSASSASASSASSLLTRGAAEASIGMHLRHQRMNDDGLKLAGAAACLDQLSLRQPRCAVLLAADRNATIAHAPAAFGRLCSVVSVARGAGTPMSNREHGPWAGAAVAQDVELLATSTHGFIGTHVSSLSFLMFAHAAYRLAEHSPQRRRLRYHTLPGCTEQPALPPPPLWPCRATCAAESADILDVREPHNGGTGGAGVRRSARGGAHDSRMRNTVASV